MRKKEVLYAVVGGVVGASLAMVAGSFSPLASYAVIGGVVGVTLTMAAGAQNKTGKFEKITCRRLDVVDEEGNALACIVIDQFGGRVIVLGKERDTNAIMGTNGFGGLVGVRDKEGNTRAGVLVNKYASGEVSTYDKNGDCLATLE